MRFVFQIILLVCALNVNLADPGEPYMVPPAKVEVFRPRGLRISIPDYPGIRLFAVHVVVNRELNGLEAGDISKDVLRKVGDRWVFEDKKIKLNYGDVMNYWLFVIRDHLGYRLDDQSYTVRDFQDTPSHFSNGHGHGHTPTRTTTEAPSIETPSKEQYVPIKERPCLCSISITNSPCPAPASSPTNTPPPTYTTPPSADIAIWRELLVNISKENAQLRQEVATLHENNQLLVSKLQRAGDENITKLRLEGKILKDDDPLSIVKTILTEKLRILDLSIVKNAVRNDDGTITFEMRTVDDKLMVLREARDKLNGAKFSIKDIDALSFADKNGKIILDQRSQ